MVFEKSEIIGDNYHVHQEKPHEQFRLPQSQCHMISLVGQASDLIEQRHYSLTETNSVNQIINVFDIHTGSNTTIIVSLTG